MAKEETAGKKEGKGASPDKAKMEDIRKKGRIEGMVVAMKQLGCSKEEITQKLVEMFHCSIKQAEYFFETYKNKRQF